MATHPNIATQVNTMHARYLKFVGAAVAALFVAACGDGPELIDRTQPNYVKKSELLDGTWYIQDTVIEVPSTTPVTFEGYQGDVDKVRFEIQEDYLVAYRTYEYLPGTDASVDRKESRIGKVVTVDGKPYRGAPIAAWRIQSHFDRIRSYNPATGEQTNVLEENTQDRPWYERDFMRVDWGTNAITNWNSLTANQESYINPYVQPVEGENEDAFYSVYSEVDGKKRLDYFDFTVRQFWAPRTYDYPGYGKIPYCWLNPAEDCSGALIRVRTSVKRVDEAHVADYEPIHYDDHLMKKFGYFRAGFGMQGPTYDRDRGTTLSGRLMFMQRHNIWQRAHDAQGNKIPVTERQVKPIVYHLSAHFPAELMKSVREMESSWDRAFRKAVAVPRGLEVSEVPQMFYICENPVPADAPAACGPAGTHVRMGDLRYNMYNWVNNPMAAGPLGYGPSGVDPETGEIIHAVANIYGAGIDSFAGSTLQLLDVLNGEISLEDLIAGDDVKDFLAENRNATDPRRADGPATSKQGLTNDPSESLGAFSRLNGKLKTKVETMRALKTLPTQRFDSRAVTNALIKQNPQLEAELVDIPEIRAAVLAAAPGETWRQRLSADPSLYRGVARDLLLRMDEIAELNKDRQLWASTQSIWLAEFSDDSYVSLAKDMKDLFDAKVLEHQAAGKSPAEARTLAKTDAWTAIRNSLNRMVGEHEVGHTLGLTHNFVGTFDAMNYMDGYWDLRKDTIGVVAGGERVMPVHPQDLLDASKPTMTQLQNGMPSLQYSTVMDYPSRFPIHSHGIGKYDEAAILFGYAGGHEPGWVEVFNETRANRDLSAFQDPNVKMKTTNMARQLTIRGAHAEMPLLQVEHWNPIASTYTDRFHYTTLPFHFADKGTIASGFDAALNEGIGRMKSRSYRKWSEMEQLYDIIRDETARYDRSGEGLEIIGGVVIGKNDTKRSAAIMSRVQERAGKIPVEVPYMYCSDYDVGYNLYCNRWDTGADVFEMTHDWMSRFDDYYVFSNFKRDRYFFNPINVMNSKYGRFTGNLPNVYHKWFFSVWQYAFYYGMTQEDLEAFSGVGDTLTQNYWTMAVIDSTNHLLSQLSTPSAGYFGKDPTTGAWVHLPQNNAGNTRFSDADEASLRTQVVGNGKYADLVYVPRGPGRSMYTLFENEGYDFYRRANEVGHFWDQYGALIALTQSNAMIAGADIGADELQYSLPYYLAFSDQLSSTASGVWLEDGTRMASTLVKGTSGLADVRPANFIRGQDIIWNFDYPATTGGSAPADATPTERVFPSPTWSTRFYTQLFGMAYFTDNYDQGFASQNQVFKLGSGESLSPSTDYEVVTFDDPFGGGYTYAALLKAGNTNPSAAPYQILMAQQYKASWDQAVANGNVEAAAEWESKTRDAVRNLEMMRGLYGIFGY